MSNNSSITAASPAGGTRSHGRANSAVGDSSSAAGVKRERAIEVATSPPAMSQSDSQRSTPAASQAPEVKKRKSAPGSRGVANLTPEQLAKKRANGMCITIYILSYMFPVTSHSAPEKLPPPPPFGAKGRTYIAAGVIALHMRCD